MDFLLEGFQALTWQQAVMWLIGGLLIYLAIKKDMEPALLLPMGFGAILVNLPLSPVIGSGADGVSVFLCVHFVVPTAKLTAIELQVFKLFKFSVYVSTCFKGDENSKLHTKAPRFLFIVQR